MHNTTQQQEFSNTIQTYLAEKEAAAGVKCPIPLPDSDPKMSPAKRAELEEQYGAAVLAKSTKNLTPDEVSWMLKNIVVALGNLR